MSQCLLSLIVAMDRRRLIGNETGLPWHLAADLKRFRKLTTGKPIIMGRKTFEHIGRPLPDRLNIVATRRADFAAPGCLVVHSLDDALTAARLALPELGAEEILIVGGADIYRQALPLVERVYLTIVAGEFAGNSYFPPSEFRGKILRDETFPPDMKNPHAHRFVILDRDDGGVTLDQLLRGP